MPTSQLQLYVVSKNSVYGIILRDRTLLSKISVDQTEQRWTCSAETCYFLHLHGTAAQGDTGAICEVMGGKLLEVGSEAEHTDVKFLLHLAGDMGFGSLAGSEVKIGRWTELFSFPYSLEMKWNRLFIENYRRYFVRVRIFLELPGSTPDDRNARVIQIVEKYRSVTWSKVKPTLCYLVDIFNRVS